MNWIRNLIHWGGDVWSAITGLPGDVASAFTKVWHFIVALNGKVEWLIRAPVVDALKALAQLGTDLPGVVQAIQAVVSRVQWWIWTTMVRPAVLYLERLIAQLRAWTTRQLIYLTQFVILLYHLGLAYTRQQVGIERAQRIAAVRAEHAAMLKTVAAALALVQREASSGYNTSLPGRQHAVTSILDNLATRNPVVKGLITRIIGLVLDLAAVDNPAARLLATFLLGRVLNSLGVDRVAGDLASRLLGTLAAQPTARTLYDVAKDTGERLGALEQQWADFMNAGGPEVEQAGQEWKAITNVATDAALLGFFGLALADPGAWAKGVADTVGTAGNDALTGIIDAIRKA